MRFSPEHSNLVKLNVKNMRLVNALNDITFDINENVEQIRQLAEQCYQETKVQQCAITAKNAQRVVNYTTENEYISSHVYLIRVDVLIDSIALLEDQLATQKPAERYLPSILQAAHSIGDCLRTLK